VSLPARRAVLPGARLALRVLACLLLLASVSPFGGAASSTLAAPAARPVADVQPNACQLYPLALSGQTLAASAAGRRSPTW